jgi:DNA sulfur modification protein DndB
MTEKIVKKEELPKHLQKGWILEQVLEGGKYRIRRPKKWEKFEFDVKRFLEEAGFENVDGGRDFKLGGWQIDACGGCDEYFLVIECKSADKEPKKDVRSVLAEFAGKKKAIEEDVLKRYRGKYKEVIQIMCLKDIDPSKDQAKAEELGIGIWTDDYLKFYDKTKEYLRGTVKYHLLADLGLNLPEESSKPRPAFKLPGSDGRSFYVFLIDAESLLKIAYVFRRGIARGNAYQRALLPKRLEGIREFIAKGGFFANNIIVNFRYPIKFEPYERISQPEWGQLGVIHVPTSYCSAQIIDGQHRVYGFASVASEIRKKHQLVVVAFEELGEDDQAELFLTINREQKPVNPNLLWDLVGEITPTKADGVISRLVKELESKDGSPLRGEIFIPAKHVSGRGKPLTIGNICNGIKRYGIISEREIDQNKPYNLWKGNAELCLQESYRIFRKYFEVIKEKFDFDWKKKKRGFTLTNNGVNVMLLILRELLIWKGGREPSRSEMEEILDPIAQFLRKKRPRSINDMRRRCSNEGERKAVALEFMEIVYKKYERHPNYRTFAVGTLREAGRI